MQPQTHLQLREGQVIRRLRFAQRRKALGLSQEQLAERLRVERSTVVRWERGETSPQPWLRPRLARLLQVDRDELAALLEDTPPNSTPEDLRRTLDKAISGGSLPGAVLDDWERSIAQYGRSTRNRVPQLLLADLTADLAELGQAFTSARSASSLRRLAYMTAQMAGLMCLTLIKLDDRAAFRQWARTARVAADEAGDPAILSWVLAQEAYGHYYALDFSEAVNVAVRAQQVGRTSASVGPALAAALEGRAHAAMGQHEAARTAMARAEAFLGQLTGDALIPSAFGYNEAQLRFHEGNAYTKLHDVSRALPSQARALELCAQNDYMDRTMVLLDQADCLVQSHEITEGVTIAVTTLETLDNAQRAGIIALRAQEIFQAIPPNEQRRPVAAHLRDLMVTSRGDN